MLQLYIKKQKNDEVICSLAWDIIFTDYWKVLVLNFSVIGNTVFFESRSWWKDDIYWLPRSSCFQLFRDEEYDLFFSQKVGGKMVFTWSFWAFHDNPGHGKYGFACSDCKTRNVIGTLGYLATLVWKFWLVFYFLQVW